jgi:hypothetical protein
MTRKEIEAKIAKVEANIAKNRVTIDYLTSIGQSWALDCRNMQIAQASLSYEWGRMASLRKKLAASAA